MLVALQLCTDGKLSMLAYSQKCFSSTEITNKKMILEGIHLHRNSSMVGYNSAILKLI